MDFPALHQRLLALNPALARMLPVAGLHEQFDGRDGQCRDCVALQALNQGFVDHLHESGYLFSRPSVVHDHWTRASGKVFLSTLWQWDEGEIHMRERAGGITRPLRDHGDGALQSLETMPVFEHWIVLAHEAAHTVVSAFDRPFVHPDMDEDLRHAFHRHIMGPMSDSRGLMPNLFEEAFADVYAFMVLWQLTKGHRDWQDALLHTMETRRKLRAGTRLHHPGTARHQTDLALQRAMADRHHWEALPPRDLRWQARLHASAGWLDLFDPAQNAGAHVLRQVLHKEMAGSGAKAGLDRWVDPMVSHLQNPHHARWALWRKSQTPHPLMAALDAILENTQSQTPDSTRRAHLLDPVREALVRQQAVFRKAAETDLALIEAMLTGRFGAAAIPEKHRPETGLNHRSGRTDAGATPMPKLSNCPLPIHAPQPAAKPLSFWERVFLNIGQARY